MLDSFRQVATRDADPDHRDPVERRSALDWCRHLNTSPEHAEVEAILAPVTGAGQ